jgi:hypothetical protein
MYYKNDLLFHGFLITILFCGGLSGCRSEGPSFSMNQNIELTEFETIVSTQENLLAIPSVIRYGKSGFFVYDGGYEKILEFNELGEVVHEYGKKGQGPGEFVNVNNFFVTENYLHAIDNRKFYIYTFDRGGALTFSMDYGEPMGTPPPPPMAPGMIIPPNLNNQPFVTRNDLFFLPSQKTGKALYEIKDQKGNLLSHIGEIPEGSTFNLNNIRLKEEVENREVPSYYRPNAFPVADRSNPEELFLIYSAIPKIAKYDMNGQQLWERTIPQVAEVDSVTNNFYETMERLQQSGLSNRIDLQYYISGRSNSFGDLFLAMDTEPLRIHRFNNTGDFISKYKLISEGTELLPIFDIDIINNRFFIITEEAEVRVYSF